MTAESTEEELKAWDASQVFSQCLCLFRLPRPRLSCLFKGIAGDRAKEVPQKQPLMGEVGVGWMLTGPFALYPSCLFPNNRSAAQLPDQPHYALATKCWVLGLSWPHDLTLSHWASSCEAPWAQREGQGVQAIHKVLLSIYHAWYVALVSRSPRFKLTMLYLGGHPINVSHHLQI